MENTVEYLCGLIDKDIEDWEEAISNAHYGFMCYQENGSGFDKKERDRRIQEAERYKNFAADLKLKLPELFNVLK